jgi:hypothetical protein
MITKLVLKFDIYIHVHVFCSISMHGPKFLSWLHFQGMLVGPLPGTARVNTVIHQNNILTKKFRIETIFQNSLLPYKSKDMLK